MSHRKPFRPFLDMSYLGVPDASLDLGDEDMEELMTGRGSARLFLGYYDEEKVREGLQRFSVQTRLNEMGLGHYCVLLDASALRGIISAFWFSRGGWKRRTL